MYTDTQRCTGHKQDHQFSQGQYECILTPSAALATNRTISSHRGSMSGYSHPALHWPQTGPSVLTGAVRVDTHTQRCTGHKQITSSHRGSMSGYSHPALHWPKTDHQFSQGQYEWILTPSAALAKNRSPVLTGAV